MTFEKKIEKNEIVDNVVAHGGENTSVVIFKALFEKDVVGNLLKKYEI